MTSKTRLTPTLSATLVCTLLLSGLTAPLARAADIFQDVAQSQGLNYTDTTYGAAWADFDGDGRPDLWLGNHNKAPRLYRNDPVNGFELYTNFTGLISEDMHGSSWADFDNDGDQDLLVAVGAEVGVGAGPNQFLVNDNGQFVESAVAYGIDYEFSRSRHVTWLDWNGDSWLDFVIVSKNNRDSPPEAPSRVFTFNPATNTFVQENFDIHDKNNTLFSALTFGNPILAGKPAIIVSHNISGFPDGVLQYDSNGFNDETAAFNFPTVDRIRDFALADFDNDGDIDMFAVSQDEGVMLEQTGAGFTDITASSNINIDKAIFTVAADFDNDKDIDIYIGRSDAGADVNQTNIYLRNNNNGTFSQVPNASGAEGTTSAFTSGVTAADFNNDGFMDLLTTNSDNWYLPATTGPIHLFENQGNTNNFLAITLVGTLDNRDAIGARVFVTSGGTTQLREQSGGTHHRSQNHTRLHFGLGVDTVVTTLEVHWPNGNVQTFNNVLPNQFLAIQQNNPATGNSAPSASFNAITTPNELAVSFDASASVDPDGLLTGYSWNFGDGTTSSVKNPEHTYTTPGDYTVTLTVTDNNSASDTANQLLSLQSTVNIEAVGSQTANAGNILDSNPDGSPDFDTHWTSDSTLANAWLTLDIGQSVDVAQVLIAPRGDRQYDMDIYVGNTLAGGKVSGTPVASCSTPGTAAQTPTAYRVCNLPPTGGRYVTVQATNRTNFRVYAVDVVEAVSANVLPLPAFSGTPGAGGLGVAFDAANSADADGTITNYTWSFGDGNSGSGQTATHSYAATGTYLVGLTTTDNNGGSNTASAELTVAASSSGVLPSSVHAVGTTAALQDNLVDVLGNGAQDLSSNWQNNNGVLTDGWFTLDLGASNTVGSVNIAPRADRLYRLDIYVGNNLDGNGKVTGVPATSCTVDASSGNEVPSALTLCPVAGSSSGRYVSVAVINRNKLPVYGVEVLGISNTNVAPQATLATSQQSGNLTVDFDASLSTDSDGIVVAHLWTFGDGTAGAGATTNHTYADDTQRFVTLSVTDEDGAIDTVSALLLLTPAGEGPQFISHPQSLTVEAGAAATFSAATTGPGPISYQWQNGGADVAGAITASYGIPLTALEDNGSIITVVATNSAGSVTSNAATLTVTPTNVAPTAAFSIGNSSGEVPFTATVDGNSSSDSDGTITSWEWDFGDGNSATGATASNTWQLDDTYTITLTVTDDDGATDSTTTTVTVTAPDAPGIVAQPVSITALEGEAATFTVVASGGAPLAYAWRRDGSDIGGATSASYTLPAVTAADEGAVFSVFVSNASGDVTSNNALLSVNSAPVAAFTATPTAGFEPLTVNVDAAASSDANGSITTYAWNFGDGNTATGVSAANTFVADGTYTITLTVTDNDGATATATQTIVADPVFPPSFDTPPQAQSAVLGESATFSVVASGTPQLSYQWLRDSSPIPGATHPAYTTAATQLNDHNAMFSVQVSNFANAITSMPVALTVITPVSITTQPSPVSVLVGDSAVFSVNALGSPPINFQWQADGADLPGAIASSYVIANTLLADDGALISVVVSNGAGNISSANALLTVVEPNAPPTASFTLEQQANTLQANLDASASNDSDGSIVSWSWELGDTTTDSGEQISHTFAAGGSYTLTLTVTDNSGNSASTSQNLTIFAATQVLATGAHAGAQDPANLVDTQPDGSQQLSTSWQNNSSIAEAFFTLDLGTVRDLTELLIAPRGDLTNKLDISVGDTLSNGKVDGGVTAKCTPPKPGLAVPVELQVCPLPTTTGRYLTVQKTNAAVLRVHGVDVTYLTGPGNNAPTAAFTATPVAESREFDFDASASSDSDGTVTQWNWQMGDGSTVSGESVSHTYLADGTYDVVLTVTDDQGATHSLTQSLTAGLSLPMIKAPVVVSAVGGNAPQQNRVIDELANTQQNLATVWDNNSNAIATAWFTLDIGQPQSVLELRIALKRNLDYDLNIEVGNSLSNGQVAGGATALCTSPNIGVNAPASLVTCNVPQLSGRYVTVRSTNRSNYRVYGAEIWIEDPGVNNAAPVAAFSASQVAGLLDADFDGSASTDVDGSVTAWSWDFGDGSSATGATPTHSYASSGSYAVTLTVTDDQLATGEISQNVTIEALDLQPPSVTGDPQSTTILLGADASFNVSATGNPAPGYQWRRDAVNIAGANAASYTLSNAQLADSGAAFDVIVSNTAGSVTSASATLTVAPPVNQPPTASFSSAPQADGLTLNFDANASSDSDGTVTAYNWDLGDSTSTTGIAFTHTYATAGSYSVVLTVTDNNDATAQDTQTLTVSAPPSGGKVSVTVAAAGGRTAIADYIIDELPGGSQNLASRWNSGSGGTAVAWFTLDLGTSQTLSEIKLAPRIDNDHTFDIHVGDALSNGQVSSPAAAQCSTPDLGGSAQPLALFNCPVTATGRYVTIKSLNVANVRMYGAEVHTSGPADPDPENAAPTAALAGTPVANSLQVDFDASASNDSDGSIVDYEWDFGDGNGTITTSSPTISSTYPTDGTYTATVTVTDDQGATDSASVTVTADSGSTGGQPAKLVVAVEAVGAGSGIDFRAIDESANTSQNLTTHWNNGSTSLAQAWITLDLGSSHSVEDIRLAPRGDRAYNLDILVGDTLVDEQVSGGTGKLCSYAGGAARVPNALTNCALTPTSGRYVTIKSRNFTKLQIYGTEIWGQ